MEERFGPPGLVWERSPCLGHCERAPAAYLQRAGSRPEEQTMAPATLAGVAQAVAGQPLPAARPAPASNHAGGYPVLARARQDGPQAVIEAITESGLVGRGGAAFPTGRKWAAVASATAGTRYVVCNADESEPGTFKDRVLIERDPDALVEAIAIAAFATGSEKAYVYVRKEYPLVRAALQAAVAAAGSSIGVEIEIRRGGGAYVCGEETALFHSIEGRRGEPRNKPPFPAESGLFGRPTLVNNVETLLAARAVLAGDAGAAHRRLFCVTGAVQRPGVYEAGPGSTLRELLLRSGADSAALRAVLLGGAAGTFVTPDEFDVQLSQEATRAIGATLGSGVVFALEGAADLERIVLRIARFFREESCGQCVPCRVGTVRQEELLHRLAARRAASPADRALLDDLGAGMRDASICGLGQTATSAVQSAITRLGAFQ
jgi:NADH-quinone oxidoreductase subunit F